MCSLAPIRAAGAQVGDGDRENDVFPKNVGGEGFQKKGCLYYIPPIKNDDIYYVYTIPPRKIVKYVNFGDGLWHCLLPTFMGIYLGL